MKVFRCTIVKQLAGALVGALVAFGIYSAYKEFSPELSAYINVFQPTSSKPGAFAQKNLDEENKQLERRMARNQEVLDKRSAPQQEQPFERIAEKAKEFEERLNAEQEQEILKGMDEFVPGWGEETTTSEQVPTTAPTPQAGGVPGALPADLNWEQEWQGTERVPYEGGDALPSSGIGLTLVAAGALTGATALRKRKKRE